MRGIFRRRIGMPAGERPELARDERIVAWAGTSGGVLVATNHGLILPGGDRLGWHQIHKATWSGTELVLVPAVVIDEVDGFTIVADGPASAYPLTEPGDLPQQVRERVTRSVALSVHHGVDGGGLRIAARRVPGHDGLTWTVRYDPGTDGSSPEVRTQTTSLVAEAKAS